MSKKYKHNASTELSEEDFEELQDFVFRYLDKRHVIEGDTIIFKDDVPHFAIQKLFGISGYAFLFTWAIERVGEKFCMQFTSGEKKWYDKTTLTKATRANGTDYTLVNGKIYR